MDEQQHEHDDRRPTAGTPEGTATDGTSSGPTAPVPAAGEEATSPATGAADAHTLPHVTGGTGARWASAPVAPAPAPVPAPAPARRRSRRALLVAGVAAAAALVVGGTGAGGWALGRTAGETAAVAASEQQVQSLLPSVTGPGTSGGSTALPGQGGTVPQQQQQPSTGTPGGTTQQAATAATAQEQQGVVTIDSQLGYDGSARSAGTGMVLTDDGLVLTNNHVVQGATSIDVTVESTGETFTADVVGTDATADVAVLQLRDAQGLDPVTVDDDGVAVGDAVHSTGNAGGTGDLVTARGTVTATDQAITVASETGSGSESLSGLLEIAADVVAGDSGGPLRDAEGEVVGVVTAASSGSSTVTGYAIPIDDALATARQIESGQASDTVQIGLPAFLGAQIAAAGSTSPTGGVVIAGTVEGSAAAAAGLVAGDVVTTVDGSPVADADALTTAVRAHEAGDQVVVGWTDASGAARTATVTLGTGPAA